MSYSPIDRFFWRYFATKKTGNGANEFVTTCMAKKAALIMEFPTYCSELVLGGFSTPFADAPYRGIIYRKRLAKFIFNV
jgi:hypothetical protein